MFTIPLTLPSTKVVRIPELKNKYYFIILKFCTNNDYEGLYLYFKWLLFEEFKLPKDLTYIDIAYTLIFLRSIFIDSKVYIKNELSKDIGVDLNLFLQKIEDLQLYGLSQTIDVDGFKITIGLPGELYFDNIDDVIISAINRIEFQGTFIDFQKLTDTDKSVIIEKLPVKITDTIISYIKDLNDKLGNILLIEKNDVFNTKEIELTVVSNQLFYFIKSIYSHDLRSFFELIYHYNNKVIHDASLFMELTPIDTHILLGFYTNEIKAQNEELKKTKR